MDFASQKTSSLKHNDDFFGESKNVSYSDLAADDSHEYFLGATYYLN
jgi:hypothetical protein